MESIGFTKVALLVEMPGLVKQGTAINVNTDNIDAEYEALCADYEGALV